MKLFYERKLANHPNHHTQALFYSHIDNHIQGSTQQELQSCLVVNMVYSLLMSNFKLFCDCLALGSWCFCSVNKSKYTAFPSHYQVSAEQLTQLANKSMGPQPEDTFEDL